ncbi:MAG: putative RNA uridine N3 methyltransferase, partial [Halolamina sp.]
SGSLRQGIVTEVGSDGRVRVNCGLQHPISLPVPSDMEAEEGERVTVRVSSRRPVRAKLVDQSPPGYQVERAAISTVLSRPDAGVRIAASRYGQQLTVAKLGELTGRVREGTTIAFGAPGRGLPAILGVDREAVGGGDGDTEAVGGPEDGFDLWLNTVPNQGSEVVRTEEAMFATLAPLTLE